jgi:hypothetical protein
MDISAVDIDNLDYSPEGLFPNREVIDQKCKVIAEVIQALAKRADMSSITQEFLQDQAEARYAYLSKPEKLSLPEADRAAFTLGLPPELAQKYMSFRLTEKDARRWTVIMTS